METEVLLESVTEAVTGEKKSFSEANPVLTGVLIGTAIVGTVYAFYKGWSCYKGKKKKPNK